MITAWMLYIVISSTNYVINIDSQDTPASQWLVMKQVVGIAPTDTYPISTDEVAEFEQERAGENDCNSLHTQAMDAGVDAQFDGCSQ